MSQQIDGKSPGRVERREEKDGVVGVEPEYCLVASDHHEHLSTVHTH